MNQKKARLIFTILVTAVLITFIFSLVSSVFAQQTELVYPKIPGEAAPPNEVRTLPNFIKYVFNLAIAVAGLAAFVSFVYGGVRYMTSAGNPGGISDAKDQIKASLLGLVLLLGSWLLLTTINPQLVILQIAKHGGERQGVVLYKSSDCDTKFPKQEGIDFLRVKNSLSDLTGTTPTSLDFPRVGAIEFLNSSEGVGVTIFPQANYQYPSGGAPSFRSANESFIRAGECKPINAASGSVDIVWKSPGVYLFTELDCKGSVRLFVGNTASMGDFDNDAKSLKIIPSTTQISTPYTQEELEGLTPAEIEKIGKLFHTSNIITNKLGVVLFQKDGGQHDGAVFLGGPVSYAAQPEATCVNITNACKTDQEPYCTTNPNETQIAGEVSSLKVFDQLIGVSVIGAPGSQTTKLAEPPSGDGITLFGNYDFNEQEKDIRSEGDQKHCGPINANTDATKVLWNGKPLWVDGSKDFGTTIGSGDNASEVDCGKVLQQTRASSIRVDGDYIAVLFRKDGRAEVFKAPGDYRLRENHIGDDSARYLLVIPIAPNSSENRRSAPPPIKGNQCATPDQLCNQLVRPNNGIIPSDSVIKAKLAELAMRADCAATNVETVKKLLMQSPCDGKIPGGEVGGISITNQTMSGFCTYTEIGGTSGLMYAGTNGGTNLTINSSNASQHTKSEVLGILQQNARALANYCKDSKNQSKTTCLLQVLEDANKTKFSTLTEEQLNTAAKVCTDIISDL